MQIDGETMEAVRDLIIFWWGAPKSLQMVTAAMRLKDACSLKEELCAWGWCTGTTQRDGMGREEGGGFRMGNTCIPVADSF